MAEKFTPHMTFQVVNHFAHSVNPIITTNAGTMYQIISILLTFHRFCG